MILKIIIKYLIHTVPIIHFNIHVVQTMCINSMNTNGPAGFF